MCGVVGYIGKNIDKALIERLVYESEVRGTHNIGRASSEVMEPKSMRGQMMGMVHTRYCTSGETHQPLKIKGNLLAFNGVIHMGTKKEIEKVFNIKMETDNDGEIILQKCRTPEQVLEFITHTKCSFAGLVLMGSRFVALRNKDRPLWMAKYPNKNVLIASTKDIFFRAGVLVKHGKLSKNVPVVEELKPLKLYEW